MRSQRLLHLAALVEVLAAVAAAVVVFFGGATVSSCLGGGASCGQPVLVVPPIRTNEGMIVSLAVCGLAWLVANYVILGHLARVDRRRLVRLALGIALFAIAMGAIGFLQGLEYRLRSAAEGGIAWSLAGLVLAWIIAIAWVGLRPGTIVPRVTPSSTGRP